MQLKCKQCRHTHASAEDGIVLTWICDCDCDCFEEDGDAKEIGGSAGIGYTQEAWFVD